MRSKQGFVVLLVVAQAAIFGAGNVMMKLAYDGITPLWCTAMRFGLAFAVMMMVCGPRVVRMVSSTSPRLWLVPCFWMGVSFLASSVSVDMTSATNAGFFMALPMLFTPILSLVLLHRRYTKGTMMLQALVIAGLYLLTCNAGGLSIGAGEVLALASSAFFALSLVFTERNAEKVDAFALATLQIGSTFLMAAGAGFVFEPMPNFAVVTPVSWAALAFLSICGTCLAFFLQNYALARIPSSTVSVVLCAEPVFTALFSTLVLGEYLTIIGMMGAALIVLCTVAASIEDKRVRMAQLVRIISFKRARALPTSVDMRQAS